MLKKDNESLKKAILFITFVSLILFFPYCSRREPFREHLDVKSLQENIAEEDRVIEESFLYCNLHFSNITFSLLASVRVCKRKYECQESMVKQRQRRMSY